MTACPDFRDLLAAEAGGDLASQERPRLEAHLAHCPACRETLADLRRTVEALRSLEPLEPPADFTERIMAQVRHGQAAFPPPAGRIHRLLRLPLLQAAGLVLLCVSGYLAYRNLSTSRFVPAPASREATQPPSAPTSKPLVPQASPAPSTQPSPRHDSPPEQIKEDSHGREKRHAPSEAGPTFAPVPPVATPAPAAAPPSPRSQPAPPAMELEAAASPSRNVPAEPKAESKSRPAAEAHDASPRSLRQPSALFRIRLEPYDRDRMPARLEREVRRLGGQVLDRSLPDGLRIALPGRELPALLDALAPLGRLRERDPLPEDPDARVLVEIRW